MMVTDDTPLYRARLGQGAATRGEHVLCQVLGWTGANDSLARVRVVHSTAPAFRLGHVGLVPRERLVRYTRKPAK